MFCLHPMFYFINFLFWIQDQNTALHTAAENGWLDIVEYLIGDCGMTSVQAKNNVSCFTHTHIR